MPIIEQRPLSPGELCNKERKRFRVKPQVLEGKELRKHNKRKKRHERPKEYEGPNQFITDTAKAWGLSYKDTKSLFDWINYKIEPHARSMVLTSLLRRKYKP